MCVCVWCVCVWVCVCGCVCVGVCVCGCDRGASNMMHWPTEGSSYHEKKWESGNRMKHGTNIYQKAIRLERLTDL